MSTTPTSNTVSSFTWHYQVCRMDGPDATLLARASVGGGPPHVFQLDTGSCGIVVGRTQLGPEYADATGPAATIHYMPSGNTLTGELIELPVALLGPDGAPPTPAATASVPVIVVRYDEKGCPFMGGMMGIGYHGLLDRNPLLHVMMDDGAGGTRPLSPGYVITQEGVEVGLTEGNQARFSYADLQPDPNADGEWIGPSASVTLSGAAFPQPVVLELPMLMDTGVPLMMLFADPAELPPSWAGATEAAPVVVDDGVEISITVPASGAPLLSYSFGNGLTAPEMPEKVLYMGPGGGLNTGIHVLTEYDYLLDAANYRIGYRRRLLQ